MTINPQALKDEITINPVSMPYPAFVEGNDTAIADVCNDMTLRTLNNEEVETGAIRAAVEFEWFDGLIASEQAWFEWLTVNGIIPVNDHLLQKLAGIPTANESIWATADRTAANAALTALMQRLGSRREELGDTIGTGTVTGSIVQQARLS